MKKACSFVLLVLLSASPVLSQGESGLADKRQTVGNDLCETLAVHSLEYVTWRQMYPEYEQAFEQIRAAHDPQSVAALTNDYSTRLIASMDMIYTSIPLEAWKRDVYRMTYEFCMNAVASDVSSRDN